MVESFAGIFTVSAKTPHVASVQTGGFWPMGFVGLDTGKGPPLKVISGFDGERVPLAGDVCGRPCAKPIAVAMMANSPTDAINSNLKRRTDLSVCRFFKLARDTD